MARVDVTVYTTRYGEQRKCELFELFEEFVDYKRFDLAFEAAVWRAVDRLYADMNRRDEE